MCLWVLCYCSWWLPLPDLACHSSSKSKVTSLLLMLLQAKIRKCMLWVKGKRGCTFCYCILTCPSSPKQAGRQGSSHLSTVDSEPCLWLCSLGQTCHRTWMYWMCRMYCRLPWATPCRLWQGTAPCSPKRWWRCSKTCWFRGRKCQMTRLVLVSVHLFGSGHLQLLLTTVGLHRAPQWLCLLEKIPTA